MMKLTPEQEEYKRQLVASGYSEAHATAMARDGHVKPPVKRGRPRKDSK